MYANSTAAFCVIAQNWKESTCSTTDEYLSEMCSVHTMGCVFSSLSQRSANCGLAHGPLNLDTYLFTCCLWLLSCSNIRVEWLWQRCIGCKAENMIWPFTEKNLPTPVLSERSRRRKTASCIITSIWNVQKRQISRDRKQISGFLKLGVGVGLIANWHRAACLG